MILVVLRLAIHEVPLPLQYCQASDVSSECRPRGPATTQQLIEAYEAATADISCEVWDQFYAEFGVGIVK